MQKKKKITPHTLRTTPIATLKEYLKSVKADFANDDIIKIFKLNNVFALSIQKSKGNKMESWFINVSWDPGCKKKKKKKDTTFIKYLKRSLESSRKLLVA